MEDALTLVGLQKKEIMLYKLLLRSDLLTASQIANKSGESRTNTYMLLENLVEVSLVVENEAQPVKRFGAADPAVIDELLADKQQTVIGQRKSLRVELDDLRSQYRLARNQPGVVSGEGMENFDASLRACMKAKTPIFVFGSDDAPQNPKAYELLKKRLYQRKRKGVETKLLFHIDENKQELAETFENRGHEARFIGDTPFAGEVVVYDHTVVFTTYVPALITTTITDERMASTIRTMFNLLWCQAER